MDAVETRIAKCLIKAILDEGYSITVYDGEEDVLARSKEAEVIFQALASTDEDVLRVYDRTGKYLGWIRLIYGNGTDLIADHTARLEELLIKAAEIDVKLEEEGI